MSSPAQEGAAAVKKFLAGVAAALLAVAVAVAYGLAKAAEL